MSNKKTSALMKGINIIFESVGFVILSYLLLSGMYSFKTGIAYILFFAMNVVVIQKFWVSLKDLQIGNIAIAAIFVICFLALTGVFFTLGYLSMSVIPIKSNI
ncbi:MAG: hypothetical protein GX790_03900 [Syntrophomonadaceae bacterium]|nr:hypothetical protein [Syntrophomonadaceae bacterium]